MEEQLALEMQPCSLLEMKPVERRALESQRHVPHPQ
jgi:hypothetical protein